MYQPRPHADDESLAPEDREKALGIPVILFCLVMPFVIGANDLVFAACAVLLLLIVGFAVVRTEDR